MADGRNRKKLNIGLLALLSVMINTAALSVWTESWAAADPTRQKIAIVKSLDIPFFNTACQGVVNGLKQRGYRSGDRAEIRMVALVGDRASDAKVVRDVLSRRPNLVVTIGTDATRLVWEQKPEIPVVFSMVLNPVTLGVVKSNDEPGGQFTGTSLLVSPGKQLETLVQVIPTVRRIGVLFTEGDTASMAMLLDAENDARRLKVELKAIAVKPSEKSKPALQQFKGAVDSIWIIPDPASTSTEAFTDTLAFAQQNRLPILGPSSVTVQLGAVVALSANLADIGDETAEMAAHILDGTDSPAKMRVRGPRRTLLSLNLGVMRSLGLTLSDATLSLADEVIDSRKEAGKP